MNKEQTWEQKLKRLHIREPWLLCKSRVAVQLWSLLFKWHNFDLSSFFHQELLLVSVKTDSVFLGVHVLCRDLVMGEMGAAWLCWCCCRGNTEMTQKRFFLHRYTPDLLQTKRFCYMSLCFCKVHVWTGREPAVGLSLLYPSRWCSHIPKVMTRPVLSLLLTSIKAVPISVQL